MVEVIKVRDWDSITRSNFNGFNAFVIRLQEEETLFEIAKTLDLPFIFQKGKEYLCSDGTFLYWYKRN
ncbi:MAG: hypothetical protein HWN66_00760 [Candidatus Helarchaeota archaeon]|nr:hypothetical protein [Candidatus Helarchaeota archaeon]